MKHVVGVSGGKDSTALALRLAEVEPRDYTYIATPTGRELPEVFQHLDRLEKLLGKEILRLQIGTLEGVIREQGAIPNPRSASAYPQGLENPLRDQWEAFLSPKTV